jgi:hypothetical protein
MDFHLAAAILLAFIKTGRRREKNGEKTLLFDEMAVH